MDSFSLEDITDIQVLKLQRADRKGIIMKLSKSYDALKAFSLEDTDEEELLRIKNGIQESVRDYDALQVLVQEPATNSAEEMVEEQQVTKNSLLQREVNLLEKTTFAGEMQMLLAHITRMEKSKSFIADVAVEQYKACSQDYDKLEWDCSRVKHVQFLKTWEEHQTRFLTLQARVEEDRTEKPLSTTTASKITSASSSSSRHRMDKLPLPTFEGVIASFEIFLVKVYFIHER